MAINIGLGKLTNLVFRQDPAKGSHSWRRSDNAMQRDLPDLNQFNSSIRNADYVVIQDVLVSVN